MQGFDKMLVIGSLSSAALVCLADYSLYYFGDPGLDVCRLIRSDPYMVPNTKWIDMKLCCNEKCFK